MLAWASDVEQDIDGRIRSAGQRPMNLTAFRTLEIQADGIIAGIRGVFPHSGLHSWRPDRERCPRVDLRHYPRARRAQTTALGRWPAMSLKGIAKHGEAKWSSMDPKDWSEAPRFKSASVSTLRSLALAGYRHVTTSLPIFVSVDMAVERLLWQGVSGSRAPFAGSGRAFSPRR
jgi:hypothetical protein